LTYKRKFSREERIEIFREFMKGNKYCVGRKLSDATRQKISESMRGHFVSAETRRKMSTGLIICWKRRKEKLLT
jgi:hypothetical protein